MLNFVTYTVYIQIYIYHFLKIGIMKLLVIVVCMGGNGMAGECRWVVVQVNA